MMTFHVEPLASCWDDVMRLASAHWHETEGYRHGQPFNPLRERYEQYERSGWFFMVMARQDEGLAVGYAGMYCLPSMHTQQMIAVEDTYFLLSDYRKGHNAMALYKFVEAECRARGVVEITMTAKLTNKAGKILEYLAFSATAVQYTKQLQPTIRADSAITPTEENHDVGTPA